jgi:DNA processing protein
MSDSFPGPDFAPPSNPTETLHWLQLIRSRRVGPATFRRLMGEHGTAKAALGALPAIAAAAGVSRYSVFAQDAAEAEMAAGTRLGARLICLGAADYPADLADIGDAPPVLWALGDVALLSRPTMALVGARNASSLGTRMAKNLARDLGAAGYVIASGLARGVDAAAHHAALESGTIAVMAGGIDQIYPAENTALAAEIAKSGLILSEHPPGLSPQARHFPRRNRIISGLSKAVIVVEGAAKSGSLITAREAADQGRDVMAVPGHPMDSRAAGCNMLIRDGAVLVRSANDVIEALSPSAPAQKPQSSGGLFPDEPPRATPEQALDLSRRILSLLSPSPVAEDQIIRETGAPSHLVSSQLVALELEGRLLRQAGGTVSLSVPT